MAEKSGDMKALELQVNGEQLILDAGDITVERLLAIQDVESPDMVSVQLNGRILDRAEFASVRVADGDEINFLYFMGGGE